jgi:hypothetical protein
MIDDLSRLREPYYKNARKCQKMPKKMPKKMPENAKKMPENAKIYS